MATNKKNRRLAALLSMVVTAGMSGQIPTLNLACSPAYLDSLARGLGAVFETAQRAYPAWPREDSDPEHTQRWAQAAASDCAATDATDATDVTAASGCAAPDSEWQVDVQQLEAAVESGASDSSSIIARLQRKRTSQSGAVERPSLVRRRRRSPEPRTDAPGVLPGVAVGGPEQPAQATPVGGLPGELQDRGLNNKKESGAVLRRRRSPEPRSCSRRRSRSPEPRRRSPEPRSCSRRRSPEPRSSSRRCSPEPRSSRRCNKKESTPRTAVAAVPSLGPAVAAAPSLGPEDSRRSRRLQPRAFSKGCVHAECGYLEHSAGGFGGSYCLRCRTADGEGKPPYHGTKCELKCECRAARHCNKKESTPRTAVAAAPSRQCRPDTEDSKGGAEDEPTPSGVESLSTQRRRILSAGGKGGKDGEGG